MKGKLMFTFPGNIVLPDTFALMMIHVYKGVYIASP